MISNISYAPEANTQPNYQQDQYQSNYYQNQPNSIPQNSTPFTPSESNDVQKPNPPQANSHLYQENPVIDLSGFTPYIRKSKPEPAKLLPGGKPNKYDIAIDITGESSHEEEAIQFTLYNIEGHTAQRGAFSATKGYVDFANIYHILVKKFPGADKYIFLPDKSLFGSLDDHHIQARRDELTKFLKMVACSTDIFFSDEFQQFLATGPHPPKQQVNFIKQQNPSLIYRNVEDINITIVRQFQKKDLITSHVEYAIQGTDSKGDFTVNRRYSDFVLMREILVGNFPKVPFKHLPGVTSSGTERMNDLIAFLKCVPSFPEAYHSAEWQLFIRDTEPDIQKKLKPFKKSTSVLKVLF